MYGTEICPEKKAQEKKLDVAEGRMLRWMCGVTVGQNKEQNKVQQKWEKYRRKCRTVG